MAPVAYRVEDHVAVLTLDSGENRFNPGFLDALLEALDRIERETEASVLVVRSAHEKIFCNGIDLEWLAPVIQGGDTETAKAFFHRLNHLFRRLLTYPAVTVAAIGGHAFAGGAILCCAFDFRFMRAGRGYFCLPEVDIDIPFLPGMNAILETAIPRHRLVFMELTGARLTAEQCEAWGIVHKACPLEDLMDEVTAFAGGLKKKRKTIGEMKRRLHRSVIRTIETEDPPYIDRGVFHIG